MTKRAIAALLAITLPAAAQAEVPQVNWRYDEDWSAADTDAWWGPAKHVALTGDGEVHASFGLEARARQESFRANEWGSADTPDDGYLWLRLMPHADLHAGPARVFVQGIAGYARGVASGPGPADETGIDLLQGFADIAVPLGAEATLTLRGGRELIALGSERLVGIRYGPNVPQAFDGARAIMETGDLRIDAFRVRPVAIGQRDFDDETSETKRLSGLYVTRELGAPATLEAYFLAYTNEQARFQRGSARERRRTFGARLSGRSGGWSYNWEAMLQRGSFGGHGIRAWSIASETGYTLSAVPLKPRITLRANIASGDKGDGDRLQTFNALFPKGKYFGELSPIGPMNIINLHPAIDLDLGGGFELGVAGVAYWRQSKGDGIYDLPGNLARRGTRADRRFIGAQGELLLSWQADPTLSYAASYSLFAPGGFIEDSGPARTIHMLGLEAMFRF